MPFHIFHSQGKYKPRQKIATANATETGQSEQGQVQGPANAAEEVVNQIEQGQIVLLRLTIFGLPL